MLPSNLRQQLGLFGFVVLAGLLGAVVVQSWKQPAPAQAGPLWYTLQLPPAAFDKSVAFPPKTLVPRHSAQEFTRRLKEAPASLGSVSIGLATRGFLFGARHLGESPLWKLTAPEHAWGTEESVAAIQTAIAEVARLHPGAHELHVGHLSRKDGGRLRPHRSHQSGRDVDLGFYYLDDSRWYQVADESNLDVTRTWALLSALLKTTSVEYIFLDRSISSLLASEAARCGEPPRLVELAFRGDLPRARPLIRHVRGHHNHMHARFLSPVAVENANRAISRLGRIAYRGGKLLKLLKTKQQKSLASVVE